MNSTEHLSCQSMSPPGHHNWIVGRNRTQNMFGPKPVGKILIANVERRTIITLIGANPGNLGIESMNTPNVIVDHSVAFLARYNMSKYAPLCQTTAKHQILFVF